MMANLTFRSQAMDEIAKAIESTGVVRDAGAEYDLDSILDETYDFDPARGYVQLVSAAEFWESVERNEKGV